MYSVDLYSRVRRACHVEGMSIRVVKRCAAGAPCLPQRQAATRLLHVVPALPDDPAGRPSTEVSHETGSCKRLSGFRDSAGGPLDPSRKSGGALHRLHCFCLEFDGACEVQRRVPTDWIIEPVDVSGYGSFSLAS